MKAASSVWKVRPLTFLTGVHLKFASQSAPASSTTAYEIFGFAFADLTISPLIAKPTPMISWQPLSTNALMFGAKSADEAAARYSAVATFED